MRANKAEIKRALELFCQPGSIVELRILNMPNGNSYTATYTGYFDDLAKMTERAAEYSGKAPAVYFTLQQCKPCVLARAANRMKRADKGKSTRDTDIERYLWLPIDCDAVRPAGISSSNAEHDAAQDRARAIIEYLRRQSWPEPIIADSGNGAHVCYKIDLPNDAESSELIHNCIKALQAKFGDDVVNIDETVFNAARIWKLYGTLACKGDATADRPHRMTQIISAPDKILVVPRIMMQNLALTGKVVEAKQKQVATKPATTKSGEIDVIEWCNRHGLNIDSDWNWKDGHAYQLKPCPFNADHVEAIIIKHPNGAVSFKCQHNGCKDNDWQKLRAKFEPAGLRKQAESITERPKPAIIKETSDPARSIKKMYDAVEAQARGERITIPLPWPKLSKGSNALKPGTMTILAGPMKTGKSYFTMQIMRFVHSMGYKWAYLPLEDNAVEWGWRMLAILAGDYRVTESDQIGAELRAQALVKYEDELYQYLSRVTENPRAGVKNSLGETIIPEVTHHRVLNWIARASKSSRVIVVDPISQIEFNGASPWKQESEFVRNALGIIADTDSSLILVSHTRKRTGADATLDLNAEDVSGSAMYTRLAHTTILLDACELKEAEVIVSGAAKEVVSYDRVVTIAAARNGGASRSRIAYMQDRNKPNFEEYGFIVKNRKGNR